MKRSVSMILLMTLTCYVLATAASGRGSDKAGKQHCSGQVYEVNAASESRSGDKVRGPVTVKVTNVNILRYDAQLGSTVTFTAGPDLSSLGIVPSIPKPDAKTDKTAKTPAPPGLLAATVNPIDSAFNAIVDRLDKAEDAVADLMADIDKKNEKVRLDGARIKTLVESSDAVLRGDGGPLALVNAISTVLLNINPDGVSWPATDIEILKGKLAVLRNDLDALKALDGWSTWYSTKGAAYEATKARVVELQTGLKAIDSTSDVAKKFNDALDNVRRWAVILTGVQNGGANGFTLTTDACCGFSFGDTKSNKIELIKTDRLAAPGTASTRDEIVTVECTTPFSISGGFGFSSVDEREFVFVSSKPPAGGTDPVNTFGFKNRSSFRTIPLILINTRLKEWNDTFALHASAGAGVDIKTGQPADGTDIEFIVGGSISFKRSFFVTTGVHVGRVSTLAGGFNLGDTVPSGLSAPPIEKTWKPGFIVAFTYKIK